MSGDDTEDVALLHDEEVLAIDLHFGTRPLAEQNAVARLDVEGNQLARLVAGAGADGDDFAFLRLFFRRIGNDNSTLGLFFAVEALDDDAIMQGTESHVSCFLLMVRPRRGTACPGREMPDQA